MGAKEFKGNYKQPNDNDIEMLEKNIERFCNDNQNKIKNIFDCGFNSEENIRFSISENGEIEKDDANDSFALLKDYVISFSIPGKMNPSKCALTFFNLGSFFGANGFLYSICLFYSYFSKIYNKYNDDEEIKQKINECLNAINNNDIHKLNIIWDSNINEDNLKSLRKGKDFLTNTFYISENELKQEFISSINSNFWGKWKNFKYNLKKIGYWIALVFTTFFSKRNYNKQKQEYVKFKNIINRKKILEKIVKCLQDTSFFKNYNLFIIAMDENQVSEDNCFSTFMGYYCPGLGKNHLARKLKYQVDDGFNSDEKVYNYYCQIIYNIRYFFVNYKDKIININENIDLDFYIKEENDGESNQKISRKKDVIENGIQEYFPEENNILTNESDIERELLQ